MRLLLLTVGLLLCSCSRQSKLPQPRELKPPVEVEIPQSFVTNGKLHVKVSLRPLVNLRADQVAVDLIGVNHGQEVVKKSLTLNNLVTESIIKADVPLVTDFEMDAIGFDEYKVVCRWSAAGVSPINSQVPLKQKEVPQVPGKFELLEQTLESSDCKETGDICERTFLIKANLKNQTLQVVSNISLALEIQFVPKGQKQKAMAPEFAPLTAEEQEVKLEGLTLSPNETRPIEVKIPEALVEIPDGMFVPRIRLYSFK